MKVLRTGSEGNACLVVKGELTIEYSREIEYLVAEVIHCQAGLKIDLAGVEQVDLYGSRLVRVLNQLVQDKTLEIVATSPIVEQSLIDFSYPTQTQRLSVVKKTAYAPPFGAPGADAESRRPRQNAASGTLSR